jgi:hypothetical protein
MTSGPPFDAITISILRMTAEVIARKRLDIGPAIATSILSALGFFMFIGFIGTGFPQPKLVKTIRRNPTGSKWAAGFRVSLP